LTAPPTYSDVRNHPYFVLKWTDRNWEVTARVSDMEQAERFSKTQIFPGIHYVILKMVGQGETVLPEAED